TAVFFPAAAGIRAFHVTGVQTCALPIFAEPRVPSASKRMVEARAMAALWTSATAEKTHAGEFPSACVFASRAHPIDASDNRVSEIGRAARRERVDEYSAAVAFQRSETDR